MTFTIHDKYSTYCKHYTKKLFSKMSLLQALLGMAQCLLLRGTPAAALEQMNAVIAQQPWFLAALADKAKLLIAMYEWEQATEVVSQLLQQEPDNIQALHLAGQRLRLLCHQSLLPKSGQ